MIAEVAAPAAGPALEALGLLAGLLVVLGVIYAIHGFVHALFGWSAGLLGHVPFIGGALSLPFHKIEQKVTHELGVWELKIDSAIGTSWHLLASYVTFLVRSIEYGARETLAVAAHLAHFPTRRELFHLFAKALGPLWGHIRALFRMHIHTQHQVKTTTHTATHADKTAHVAQATATTVGVRWWRLRITRRLARVESEVARLARWIRGRKVSLATGAFVGAAAWALGRLGVSWIRCNNWKRLGRQVCQLPASTISTLLGLLAAVWALSDIRRTARFAESIADEVARDIVRAVHGGSLPDGRFTID